jgi:outer membrane receptor for ferrienterochelin and colicin
MRKLIVFFTIFLFGIFNIIQAQEIVRGHVFEKDHDQLKPLVGANVIWLGTTSGTVTDGEGHFEIKSPGHHAHHLVISYVGYQTDTIHVHDHDSDLDIVLGSGKQLDEVAITHRKAGTHISRKDPMHTQKITGEELCKAACCNLSESFETNAAVDVSYADAATGVKRIQMLGLTGMYIQMMTENNPNFRGLSNSYGLEYIPGTWMESIQVSKGASSVINGYESVTGQINVELKKPDTEEKGFINMFSNTNQRFEGNAGAAVTLNDAWSTSVMAHGSYLNRKWDENNDSFLDDPLIKRYSLLNRWKYEQEHFNAQMGLTVVQEDRLGGQVSFEPNKEINPSNGYGININTSRFDGFFKVGYIFKNNEDASIAIISNFTHHNQDSYYGLRTYDANHKNLHTNLVYQSTFGSNHHGYSAGLSYNRSIFDEQYNDSSMYNLESVPGSFFQYTLDLDEKFVLLAGIRADYHSVFDLFFTPRIHLKYEVNEDFIIRSSAGKGYRTPYVIADNSFLLASARRLVFPEKFQMEEAWNYGISVTKYLNIFNRPFTAIADVYRTDFMNQTVVDIDTDPQAVIFRNLNGKSFSNNYQIELKYEAVKNLELNMAYRYSDVRITIQDVLLEKALVNRFKGLFTLSYQTSNKTWQFDYNTQWNGDGRLPGLQDTESRYPSFFQMSGQITRYFNALDIYAGVENITGYVQKNPIIDAENPFSDTFDAAQIWGPIMGRRFYIGLRYSFN